MEDRENRGRCWVSVVYNWGDEGLTIARTLDPNVLLLTKRQILNEARKRLEITQELDEVIATLDRAELKRLRDTLDLLVPEEENEFSYK